MAKTEKGTRTRKPRIVATRFSPCHLRGRTIVPTAKDQSSQPPVSATTATGAGSTSGDQSTRGCDSEARILNNEDFMTDGPGSEVEALSATAEDTGSKVENTVSMS
ncbi:hypothetical protein AURDEDRAFT_171036 [Auricularia subglabra TFB-10046 SS5]|nr:hypothetical protein AURDEDRAFT_171036 [Auricularia subglabra TFB-10046 SS5]